MIKPRIFIGYCFSILGTAFFVVTIIFIFSSNLRTGDSIVIYPYRPLVAPALISGLVFFSTGIISIWNEYLMSQAKKRLRQELAAKNRE